MITTEKDGKGREQKVLQSPITSNKTAANTGMD